MSDNCRFCPVLIVSNLKNGPKVFHLWEYRKRFPHGIWTMKTSEYSTRMDVLLIWFGTPCMYVFEMKTERREGKFCYCQKQCNCLVSSTLNIVLEYHARVRYFCTLFARKAFSKHECSANGNCTPFYVHLRISTKECQITKEIDIERKLQELTQGQLFRQL